MRGKKKKYVKVKNANDYYLKTVKIDQSNFNVVDDCDFDFDKNRVLIHSYNKGTCTIKLNLIYTKKIAGKKKHTLKLKVKVTTNGYPDDVIDIDYDVDDIPEIDDKISEKRLEFFDYLNSIPGDSKICWASNYNSPSDGRYSIWGVKITPVPIRHTEDDYRFEFKYYSLDREVKPGHSNWKLMDGGRWESDIKTITDLETEYLVSMFESLFSTNPVFSIKIGTGTRCSIKGDERYITSGEYDTDDLPDFKVVKRFCNLLNDAMIGPNSNHKFKPDWHEQYSRIMSELAISVFEP